MLRGTTTRTVISALAAVLLTLQLFAPTASFAVAHTPGHIKTRAEPGNTPKAKPVREKAVTYRTCGHPEDPTGPLRARDRHRHRHRAAIHTVPGRPRVRCWGENPAAASEPERLSTRHHRPSRPLAAHTPAALQVFRC